MADELPDSFFMSVRSPRVSIDQLIGYIDARLELAPTLDHTEAYQDILNYIRQQH